MSTLRCSLGRISALPLRVTFRPLAAVGLAVMMGLARALGGGPRIPKPVKRNLPAQVQRG